MLKLTSMNRKDYEEFSQITVGDVMRNAANSPRGLNSLDIFGEPATYVGPCGEKDCKRENIRGMIKLIKPVINQCKGGPNGDFLNKILGVNGTDFKKVIKFQLVLDVNANVLDTPANLADYSVSEVMCHGDILKKWIDEFDVDEAIVLELCTLLKSHGYNEGDTFSKYSGDIHVIGDWYWNLVNPVDKDTLQERVYRRMSSILTQGKDSRISLLINMKNKDALYGMLMDRIMVLPADIRPAMENLHDQFTLKYSEVLKQNYQLSMKISNQSLLKEYALSYATLVRSVNELIYKSSDADINTFSIQEKLSGKAGFIRDKMLGKRVDYSGRSVIIVNPDLALDECGIPEEMMPKLFRYHLMKSDVYPNVDKLKNMSDKEVADRLEKLGILRRVPVMLNRAPTLHRLSFLGFKVKRAKGKAIELNPLVCTGYNADFDGDAMAVHVPCCDEAVRETKELMLSTRNLFTPSSGKPTLVPRQEIIYGLNIASKTYGDKPKNKVQHFKDLDELCEAVLNHDIKVWDPAEVQGVGRDTAGRQVVKWCLPEGLFSMVKEITEKSIDDYISALLPCGIVVYNKSIGRMVKVGFELAKLYAPTCNILVDIQDEFLKDPFKKFHENMKRATELHDLGFEDDESYQRKFDVEFKLVEREMENRIEEVLGEDNGYLQLVNSGARGSKDNLIQIYGYKGKIKKSSYQSFNAVIENSFTKQLNPLEHFISAYGARKGMIDKVQKTRATGYTGRLMFQAGSDVAIVTDDCGTLEGLRIRKADISHYVKSEDEMKKQGEVIKIFKNIITGRYVAKSDKMFSKSAMDSDKAKLASLKEQAKAGSISVDEPKAFGRRIKAQLEIAKELKRRDYYINEDMARQITDNFSSVKLRSPVVCKAQCCAKCYGEDLTIHGEAVEGLAVGFIAGQSIGEPGTQLTMRTFHTGGVAGKADVTSDFDRMQAFIEVSDISKKGNYDPIAWGSGKVVTTEKPAGLKVQIEGYKNYVTVPKSANIKSVAVKGEGLCEIEGDHNIKELLQYSGAESAQKYLLYSMYTTYLGKANVNFKHFEVLVSAMTLNAVIKSNRSDLRPGLAYSNAEIYSGPVDGVVFSTMIKSVKSLQTLKSDPLSTILMEQFGYGVARSVFLGLESNHEARMGRLMLGMLPNVGTGLNPNYIEERGRKEVYYGIT